MSKENKTQFAILGMLSLAPMSGYDLKKTIERSIGHFWHENYPQIYPILKQLTDEGLTTRSLDKQQGRPDRYSYTLTDQGWQALRRWLDEPFERRVERNELLLKLFFGNLAPLSTNIKHLRQQQSMQESLLQTYEQTEEHIKRRYDDDPRLTYWLLTISQGKHIAKALMNWCDEAIAVLQQQTEGRSCSDQQAE